MARRAGLQLGQRHPDRAHHAVVKRTLGMEGAEFAREGKAHVGDVGPGARAREAVHVDAHQRPGREAEGGFFEHFARAGFNGRFRGVQMPGRHVQLQPVGRLFFDQ
ncbi:hypothetical protein D3C80_1695030 [compost metagenome]